MELLHKKKEINQTVMVLEGKMRSFICSDDSDGFGWVIIQPWNGYIDPEEEKGLEIGKAVSIHDQPGLVIVSPDIDAVQFLIDALQEMKQVMISKGSSPTYLLGTEGTEDAMNN